MDKVQMTIEVLFIPQGMLPKPALPDCSLATLFSG